MELANHAADEVLGSVAGVSVRQVVDDLRAVPGRDDLRIAPHEIGSYCLHRARASPGIRLLRKDRPRLRQRVDAAVFVAGVARGERLFLLREDRRLKIEAAVGFHQRVEIPAIKGVEPVFLDFKSCEGAGGAGAGAASSSSCRICLQTWWCACSTTLCMSGE